STALKRATIVTPRKYCRSARIVLPVTMRATGRGSPTWPSAHVSIVGPSLRMKRVENAVKTTIVVIDASSLIPEKPPPMRACHAAALEPCDQGRADRAEEAAEDDGNDDRGQQPEEPDEAHQQRAESDQEPRHDSHVAQPAGRSEQARELTLVELHHGWLGLRG